MSKRYYNGQGESHSEPLILPTINHDIQTSPKGYLATPELAAAVDTALTLGMPLLLTGEPGSGKSALAKSIAWEVLGEDEKPLEFIVKSDTRATDLFYRFDSVGRFHEANMPNGKVAAQHFVHFNAMGQAILQAKPFQYVQDLLEDGQRAEQVHTGTQKRSVVLIDEIDKAPRDVPNDVLVEIERLCFDIHELQTRVDLVGEERNYQPIVIITSNSEKALPEAFLRRCVYHHLQFPAFDKEAGSSAVTVSDIVERRLGSRFTWEEGLLKDAISWFKYLRTQVSSIEKKPSMAEFLNWLEYLQATNPHATELNPESAQLQQSISHILLKKSQDQAQCKQWLSQWKTNK